MFNICFIIHSKTRKCLSLLRSYVWGCHFRRQQKDRSNTTKRRQTGNSEAAVTPHCHGLCAFGLGRMSSSLGPVEFPSSPWRLNAVACSQKQAAQCICGLLSESTMSVPKSWGQTLCRGNESHSCFMLSETVTVYLPRRGLFLSHVGMLSHKQGT